jgi:membrane-associated phospholipid phosphatase
MRARLSVIESRLLPHDFRDVLRQIMLFAGAYGAYQLVRGIVDGTGYKPFGDATKIINFERLLHVFVEPNVQRWVSDRHWLMDIADWTYLNAHYVVTLTVLVFIYLRRNDSFYFVRNMFMVSMAIALIGYWLYPTAPPRLMPEWGFTDSIQQFTGVTVESGPTSALLNFYAAVPSMHVCFAVMVAGPMAFLVRPRTLKVAWCVYPLIVVFAVVATGNHYLIDVLLGAMTAGASAIVSARWLARARPHVWSFASREPSLSDSASAPAHA